MEVDSALAYNSGVLGKTTLSTMTLSIMTLSIMTLSIMKLSITTNKTSHSALVVG
jgi:hypothetical protein